MAKRYFIGPLLLLTLGSLSACAAPVGATNIATDSGAQCGAQCKEIGMELSAVAIMAGRIGCVCQPAGSSASGPQLNANASTTSGGMAAVLLDEEAERQRQQQAQHAQGY